MFTAAFHVMLQGHGCRGMTCRRLGLLDVLGHVVEVSQNGCPEPTWCDGFVEVDVLFDSLTHFARLGIGQGLFTTQYEVIDYVASEIVQLSPPKNLVLNEDGTASWSYVENAEYYIVYVNAHIKGDENNASRIDVWVSSNNEAPADNLVTYDLSEQCERAYKQAVANGAIESGQVAELSFVISCTPYDNTQ